MLPKLFSLISVGLLFFVPEAGDVRRLHAGSAPRAFGQEHPEEGEPPPAPATEPPEGMVFVPPGEFWMGADASDDRAQDDERPRHRVYLDGYYIDRTEVPYRDYLRFVASPAASRHSGCHRSERRGKDHRSDLPRERPLGMDHPVTGVDWYDAYAFCAWAGKRLPTEAEWEKAARGADGRVFPWGSTWDASLANGKGDADGFLETAPVGSFPAGAGPFGTLDMAGNVREWVSDYYAKDYYEDSPRENPPGPEYGLYHVVRGGCWRDEASSLRCSARSRRFHYVPTKWYIYIGFRCAGDEG